MNNENCNTTIISELTTENKAQTSKTTDESKNIKKVKKPEHEIPRGKPKSNRPWKTPKTKFSTVKKSNPRLSFEKKMELRNELRAIKEKSRELKEARKEAAIAKRQRRIENAERRLVNEKRAEIVQVIKNPSKLKRMKKKHMRLIQKRDLNEVKVV